MKTIPFPNKKYSIIYADPPWSYRDSLSGKSGASNQYLTQENKWIEDLPVNEIADDNCALFLWVTYPKLAEIWNIFPKWGFAYKTVAFTWIKKNKKSNSNFWGLGNWTRANPEICIIATKGKPKRVSMGIHSVVESKIEKHSKKTR